MTNPLDRAAEEPRCRAGNSSELDDLRLRIECLQDELAMTKAKLDGLQQALAQSRDLAEQTRRELQSVYTSKSWRITGFLRRAVLATRQFQLIARQTLRAALSPVKRGAKPLLAWIVRRGLAMPAFKAWALKVLDKYPRLKQGPREISTLPTPQSVESGLKSPTEACSILASGSAGEENLSPRAAGLLVELKQAIGPGKT